MTIKYILVILFRLRPTLELTTQRKIINNSTSIIITSILPIVSLFLQTNNIVSYIHPHTFFGKDLIYFSQTQAGVLLRKKKFFLHFELI